MKMKLLAFLIAGMMTTAAIPEFTFAAEDNEAGGEEMCTEMQLPDPADGAPVMQEEPSTQSCDVPETSSEIADLMGCYVNENEINNNIATEKGDFVAVGKDADITIPGDAADGIVIDGNGAKPIEMLLPSEAGNESAEMTEEGTIIYNPENENIAIGVQPLSGGKGANRWDAVRVLVEIENSDASNEYGFKYNLPKGYQLIKAEDWYKKYIKLYTEKKSRQDDFITPGEVYIIDKAGTVVESIDPAWAFDAENNAVPTHYEVRGTELVQVVSFDENTAFPVIADPTKHPNKTVTKTISKKQVKKIRDSYTPNKRISYICTLFSLGSAFAVPHIGVPWAMASFVGSAYYTKNYSLWNNAYVKMLEKKKSKINVSMTYKWHCGHKCYYPANSSVKFYF